MVLVDTNLLAFLLIRGDRTSEAQTLYRKDPDWHSEAFVLVEFSNILATYVRTNDLAPAQARKLLTDAERIMNPGLINIQLSQALDQALAYTVSAYDARFLAAADMLGVRLITEDAKLRRAAPKLTLPLDEALG